MEWATPNENDGFFYCRKCQFVCSKESNYIKHLGNDKHKMETNGNEKNPDTNLLNVCKCGKQYSSRSGLWKHRIKCRIVEKTNEIIIDQCIESNEENLDYKSLFLKQMEKSQELMNFILSQTEKSDEMIGIIKDMIPKIGNNNNNNNSNNQFNLQVFLNEDCKDAINFSEFIEQIQVSLNDLENQAENGYIKGITKLFIDSLKGLGPNNRPIHCTDKKRKTLYIKENDVWDKEGSQDILKKGIQEVTRRTFERFVQEKKNNAEEYNDADSDFSMKCISIQRNLTPSHPRETTINKVIDNITQNTGIM